MKHCDDYMNESGTPVQCICLPDRQTMGEPPQPRAGCRDPACKATVHCTKQPLTAGTTSAIVLDTKLFRRQR